MVEKETRYGVCRCNCSILCCVAFPCEGFSSCYGGSPFYDVMLCVLVLCYVLVLAPDGWGT